ncbi:hypothetical protein HMPREF9136_2531 [Prevotella dentalis DSM 3688]|uniref:Uncharacterized protein n=1 Tax=Prevotella dentalis (strain ATCC 49559 / DSM 3688 / JCM 13448 / NCTC 12043 / ES 2772) TaxID=908937 RepID=F9D6Q3_PREDD|nr:hypothetical protein HMPREF9136_2531 [Prevotella dentalis DSM 3688]
MTAQTHGDNGAKNLTERPHRMAVGPFVCARARPAVGGRTEKDGWTAG